MSTPEDARDVVAVVPHALTTGVHVQMATTFAFGGNGECALGFEEGVFDSLSAEGLTYDVM